ncbi:MAG: glycosyltransferase family 2 protein [Bdellovibrionia bacterium]
MIVPNHSIVVPVYNEAEGIPTLVKRLEQLAENIKPETVEIIFINDGSKDKSAEALDSAAARNSIFKTIHFSRNFGHQLAITAGIELAQGKTVTVIDADLQDPPEIILELLAKWREGFDVVYAVRRSRVGETKFKLWTAKLFYRLLRKLTDVDIPVDTGDFRLMDRKVVNSFLRLRERHRFVRGMVAWLGFRQTGILYDRAEREFCETHYPFKKMIKFAFDGITSFSTVPLRLATYLGLMSATMALLMGIWTLYIKLFTGEAIQGWASVMLVVLFLGGMQLVTLGIFGEYLGRVYDEGKARPLFLIARTVGFMRDGPEDSKDLPKKIDDELEDLPKRLGEVLNAECDGKRGVYDSKKC